MMIRWFKQLRIQFGASFLWLVCLIYFTQGFRSFVWTAVSYQLKDTLKLSPSASQFVTSIAFFPWSIKPLYGILSDCVPIRGRKRIPYLVIATLLSLIPWLVLSIDIFLRSSKMSFMILLTVQNLGSAMADVVIDAMIAEAVRSERASFAGDLQSVSWMAMALGGICGSLLGGYALDNLQIEKIFLLFSILPTIQLFSCGLVEENSVGVKVLPEHFTSNGGSNSTKNGDIREDKISPGKSKNNTLLRKRSQKSMKQGSGTASKIQVPEVEGSLAKKWFHSFKMATFTLFRAFRQPIILREINFGHENEINYLILELCYALQDKINTSNSTKNGDIREDKISPGKSKNNTLLRKRSQKSMKQGSGTASKIQVPEVEGSLAKKWFHSFKMATFTLFRAFRQPIILRPMAWFFLAHVTVPNLSTVMFYYQTETLKLDASFLGTTRVVGWLGLMFGTFLYNRYLQKMKLRSILLYAQVGISLMTLLDGVLVSRLNLSVGLSDKLMVLCGSALSDGINQFKFMPFLILSGQLCPPGVEGTLFALFMSINNLGSTVGSFVGAGLASLLNISSGSFDKLLTGIIIQVMCTFIPVAFLFLIPKEATGISA